MPFQRNRGMAGWALALWVVVVNPAFAFECKSDIMLGSVTGFQHKGIALDDTTFWNCSSRIPSVWPNAEDPIRSLRLFKVWDPKWDEVMRKPAWDNVLEFVKENDVKVLLGTQISCNETNDWLVWNMTKDFVRLLDADHVMGLAIGNEMEILHFKSDVDVTVNQDCITNLWQGGGFFERFSTFVSEFDSLGFKTVPVTTVFGAFALTHSPGFPFYNNPTDAMVSDFLKSASEAYRERFVFSFNLYPYFDPGLQLDSETADQCTEALGSSACWTAGCSVPATALEFRQRIRELTGHSGTLWVGETGWSSPMASTLNTKMATCEQWSSTATLRSFYEGFLKWDLNETDGLPDHMFYFSPRDSVNFGVGEHFGLISQCNDLHCKLRSEGMKDLNESRPTSYDCEQGLENWESEWPSDKKTWCCVHMAGCPNTKKSAAGASMKTTTASAGSTKATTTTTTQATTTTTQAFDCVSGYWDWKSWPEDKTLWCCQHQGRACESNKPYDCQHWLSIWNEGWTVEKKEWCCENENLGCAPRGPSDAAQGHLGTAAEPADKTYMAGAGQIFSEYPIAVSFGVGCLSIFALIAAGFSVSRILSTLRSSYSGLGDTEDLE